MDSNTIKITNKTGRQGTKTKVGNFRKSMTPTNISKNGRNTRKQPTNTNTDTSS